MGRTAAHDELADDGDTTRGFRAGNLCPHVGSVGATIAACCQAVVPSPTSTVMRPALVIRLTVLLATAALPLAAQDSVRVSLDRGAVLRFTFGRLNSTSLEGRLERSDSALVRVMVSGEEGDVRLRADRLGLSALEAGLGDSMIVAVPWRLVRVVDVASGKRSRRAQNGLVGGVIGAGIGGGVGAVLGATMSNTTCSAGSNSNCGISSETGQGAVLGAVAGLIAGAVVGAFREAYATVWTPLPERGRALREAKAAP